MGIIQATTGLIHACDMPFSKFKQLVEQTYDVKGDVGYKFGFYAMLEQGLPEITLGPKALYNHRSAPTDINDLGKKFIEVLEPYSEIRGVIFTPLSGPKSQEEWTAAAKEKKKLVYLEPILETDTFLVSNGGFIEDDAIGKMMELALKQEVDGLIFPDNEIGMKLAKEYEGKARVYWRKNGELDLKDFRELTSYEVIPHGLAKAVDAVKGTDKLIIYDHQKPGTDIPKNAQAYAKAVKKGGAHAVIFFPQAGPEAEDAHIDAALKEGLEVIVGGHMTHPMYTKSEGGYIADDAPMRIYHKAADKGVRHFVVPGTKMDVFKKIREGLEGRGLEPTYLSPGFGPKGQKASVAAYREIAGERKLVIIGRDINDAADMREATIQKIRELGILED